MTAVFVARPLLPSEGVSWRGDGLPFDMLWILLAALALLVAVRRKNLRLRWCLPDFAAAALVLWHTISGVWGAVHGAPRPAVNMLWEWFGLGLSYFLTRELIGSPRAARALVAVMIALAASLSAYALYQFAVEIPALRAEFARDADGVLRRAGEWAPEGSTQRLMFAARLNSTEPTATFALTNSLAGFLVPWLAIAAGIAFLLPAKPPERQIAADSKERGSQTSVPQPRRAGKRTGRKHHDPSAAGHESSPESNTASHKPRQHVWWFIATLLVMAACLLLTKSRSGYVAAMLAGAVLVAALGRSWIQPKVALSVAGSLAILVGAAIALGGVDAEVLTQASKSLEYRWQYWQATLTMIKDHAWLGCGSGNFQDFYTQYKLPEASEEVRDPHNFLFEIWATAGTPALLAMVTLLAALAGILFNAQPADLGQELQTHAPGERRAWTTVAGGAAAGCALALVVGRLTGLSLDIETLAFCLFVGGGTLWALCDWIEAGRLPPWLLGVGLLALCVNLLAAGGIAFPGVAGTFWLLSGLIVNDYQARSFGVSVPTAERRFLPMGGLVAMLVAGYACYLTAYGPVLQSYAGLFRAEQAAGAGQAKVRNDALRAAAIADPFSVEPWRELTDIAFREWQSQPTTESRQEFETADSMVRRLQPHSSSGWARSGAYFLEAFNVTHDPLDAQLAASRLGRAVELYPNNPTLRAELALSLDAAGDAKRATAEAGEARRLDGITPHADKKLSGELGKRLLRIGSR